MKVKDVMVRTPATCMAETNLGAAVEQMWQRNCGILPVVNELNEVTGLITDRDICIALGTRNRLPGEITVGEVASGKLFTCKPGDDVRTALETMAAHQVRRLPVLNSKGQLEGVLSMDDIILHSEVGAGEKTIELPLDAVASALQKIYWPELPATVH
jgi:CBS domain-containing protein